MNKVFNFFFSFSYSSSTSLQTKAPFLGSVFFSTLAVNGFDSFSVFDCLSNHAKSFRYLMLSLKRSPGREAYPGDVFFLHSSLLERFGNFEYFLNGGSITNVSLTETIKNNITDYITTNLISISDGQWFLSFFLRLKNLFPSVDVSLSVSRLGNHSQSLFISVFGDYFRASVYSFFSIVDLKGFGVSSSYNPIKFFFFRFLYNSMFSSCVFSLVSFVFFNLFSLLYSNFIFCGSSFSLFSFSFFSLYPKVSIFKILLYFFSLSKNINSVSFSISYFYSFLRVFFSFY